MRHPPTNTMYLKRTILRFMDDQQDATVSTSSFLYPIPTVSSAAALTTVPAPRQRRFNAPPPNQPSMSTKVPPKQHDDHSKC
ncbi:unnamed protein product [Trichobilharzia regenti]|nr:unnamed protein product [Trichobilharzia regenti]